MEPTSRSIRRAAATVALTAITAGLTVPLLATPAGAVQETTTRRLSGGDRYGTAAAVAEDTFPTGADTVVIATGESFADALAANGLAGALDAPVLLTAKSSIPATTASTLADLDPETVFLMGGTAAVSQAVEDELAEDYEVERVQGDDRYATAAAAGDAIAATATPTSPVPGSPTTGGVGTTSEGTTAVLANGVAFADAVSAGPVAYAGSLPVLLTTPQTTPEATLTALEELGIEHVLLIGGTGVISDAQKAALESEGYSTERLAGGDRFATNVAVNRFAQAEPGYAFGGPTAYLSTGLSFADALAGGPAAGANAAPLLLVSPTALPDAIRAYLQTNGNAIDEVVAIGGTSAVSASTLTAAATAAKVGANNTFVVTPTDRATKPISSSALNSDGAREYQASGLQAGATYVIALLDAETVTTTSGGGGTFTSYSVSDEASTSIESVNGSPVGAAGGVETVQEEAVATAQGTLTFTVDATADDRVIPIVYEDLDGNDVLTLSGQTASEPFGLGGETAWLPAEAADGTFSNIPVTRVNTTDNYFIATVSGQARTFLYDGVDRFRSGETSITPAQFEGMLTAGDVVTVNYFRTAQSLFTVTTDSIPDIANVTASTPDATRPTRVQVSWTPSAQPDAVYTVYRDNGDGTFGTGDVEVSPRGTSTSRTFAEPASTTGVRYIVRTQGGTSGTVDTTDAEGDPVTFISNEVQPGLTSFGLTNGTTVSKNNGLAVLNAGDEWMLHFSRDVQVAPNATITIKQGSTPAVTFTNGTSASTWTASGGSITIVLGSGADAAPDITYGATALVTGLTGVRDLAGNAIEFSTLRDTVLEDDGPELMPESTTCDVGDTSCTIAFNEPVAEASAENRPANYTYVPEGGGRFLTTVALGADLRTITLSISPGAGAGDTLSPDGPVGAVTDDDNQASTQPGFDFVR